MATDLNKLWCPWPRQALRQDKRREENRSTIMATEMILPVLGMAQDTGKIVQWLKREGQPVKKGEPVVEVETDKATVELEAPADGVLANVTAAEGDEVPVGQVIARILAPGEAFPEHATPISTTTIAQVETPPVEPVTPTAESASKPDAPASPLASRIAAERSEEHTSE